jgi:hypothetical protein
MSISKCFAATSVCVVLAAVIALLQGCATVAPQYPETPPAVTPTAGAESAAGHSGAGMQSAGAQNTVEAREPTTGGRKRPFGVTGVWHGQLRANCNALMMADVTRCGAVNGITFTLLQNKAEVSGYYRCAYGNMNCLNMNEAGRIARGNMGSKLLRIRVMMPDGSDCLFNGWPVGDTMRGSYTCLQGGGLVEQGRWDARRSY